MLTSRYVLIDFFTYASERPSLFLVAIKAIEFLNSLWLFCKIVATCVNTFENALRSSVSTNFEQFSTITILSSFDESKINLFKNEATKSFSELRVSSNPAQSMRVIPVSLNFLTFG